MIGRWGYLAVGGWRAREWQRMQRAARRLWEHSLEKLEGRASRLWVHVSSVGEFELVVPLLRAWRSAVPDGAVVVSYFSPSFHFHRERAMGVADVAAPLLADVGDNARWLVERIKPSLALFVRYDHWLGYLAELRGRRVPVFLLGAYLYRGHVLRRLSLLGRYVFSRYTAVLTQDEHTAKMLRRWGISAVRVGDLRADRVKSVADSEWRSSLVEAFLGRSCCVVCGSTYPVEEQFVAQFIEEGHLPEVKWVVTPHDLTPQRISRLVELFGERAVVLSEATRHPAGELAHKQVLINDVAGILKYVYRYGRVAVVGGGFGRGVHSVIEPAAYRIAVLVGPRIHRSYEAQWMRERGGLFVLSDYEEFRTTLVRLLSSPEELSRAGNSAYKYIRAHAGATRRTLSILLDFQSEVVG